MLFGVIACIVSLFTGVVTITIEYRLDLSERKHQTGFLVNNNSDKINIRDIEHISGLV